MKTTTKILLIASVAAIFAACGNRHSQVKDTTTSGIATIVCDASFENIINQEIEVFEYTYKDASIVPYYTNEKACIDSLLEFKTRTIVVTHELSQQDQEFLKANKRTYRCQRIAVDAIALIVNPANEISTLSKSEVAQILKGEIRNWNQVEPSKLGEIKVVFEDNGASTIQYMRDSLMNGANFADIVHAQKSSQEVFDVVSKDKNALGIIGVSWISSDMSTREMTKEERIAALDRQTTTATSFSEGIKVLKICYDNDPIGHQPYQAYINDGSYPFYRSVYMISSGANGSLSHGFFSFVTSVIGQKIIQQAGIMPAAIQPRIVELI